ncbi:MAG TPA: hypothetical protein PLG90_04370 [Ignavibacteria bacterium]|nr:hypothetical protein [Ignavibacteria bacterium]
MKTKILLPLITLIFSLVIFSDSYACPKCNQDFREQLMNERSNTLGAKELLKTIENQTDSNQYIPSPVKYVSNNGNTQMNVSSVNENIDNKNEVSLFDKIKLLVVTFFLFR